jgi:hypothetical protein
LATLLSDAQGLLAGSLDGLRKSHCELSPTCRTPVLFLLLGIQLVDLVFGLSFWLSFGYSFLGLVDLLIGLAGRGIVASDHLLLSFFIFMYSLGDVARTMT